VSVETTAKRHWAFYPEGNALGHTNHYLAGWLKEVEYIREGSIGSSLARYAALRRFFRDKGDQVTRESLKDLTRNHTAYPRSICAHGSASEPSGARNRTVAAMVQVLAEQSLHVTRGCACENEYHAVEL
jgi:isopenicillin-N N-acyltransferase-like protein